MERLIQIAFDVFAIAPYGFGHFRRGGPWRRKQCFDKAARILPAQANDFMAGNDAFRRFPRVSNDKGGHRVSFKRGGLLKDAFVRTRDARDEPLGLLLCRFDSHDDSVCRRGTHGKN